MFIYIVVNIDYNNLNHFLKWKNKKGKFMKKLTKISFAVLGFSLVLGGFAALTRTSKKVEPVKAGDPLPKFFIGNHNLLADSIADEDDGFEGEAKLVETANVYELTLTDFSNEGAYSYDTNSSYALCMQNLAKPVNIILNGDNFLNNPNESDNYCFGIFIENVGSVLFSSFDDEYPGVLFVNTSKGPLQSNGLYAYSCGEILINNCEVYLTTDKSKLTMGLCTWGDLTIEEKGFLNVNADNVVAGGSASYGGLVFGDFHLDSGEAYFDAGNAKGTGISCGFTCNAFDMNEGNFVATSGAAENGDSIAVQVFENLRIDGGRFKAEASTSTGGKSYGVDGEAGKIVDMYRDMERFYAYGETKGCNMEISPIYEGFGSDEESIFADPTPVSLGDEGGEVYTYKHILYQRIIFEVNYDPVIYDGFEHPCMTINVTEPYSGYTIKYMAEDASDWSDELPKYTNVSSAPYCVDFLIEAPLYAQEIGGVEFYINKANGAIQVLPVKTADFQADGKDHALLTAGECNTGILMYSVNGGEYSAKVPTAKEAGEYTITYKVVGDSNHKDIEAASLGKVTVSAATPTPTPETNTPAKKGIGAGGIIGIVLGSLVVAGAGGFSIFWFVIKKKSFKDLIAVFKK